MKSQVIALPRLYGLEDLIAGVTPTYSGWTVNPTDGANITDGDITTFCTTGNKVAGGGWQYGIFEWDLGAFYNIIVSGVGEICVTAGTACGYIFIWDGAAWITCASTTILGANLRNFSPYIGKGSKIRLCIGSGLAATITPNIREFHAWRLK